MVIAELLLADGGWHVVACAGNGSSSTFTTHGVEWTKGVPGFQFMDEGGDLVRGPLTSVLAMRGRLAKAAGAPGADVLPFHRKEGQ
jgi:hypothetical protein